MPLKLTIVWFYFVLSFLLMSGFLFPNSLSLIFILLRIVLVIVYRLSFLSLIRSLLGLIIIIIYLGAIIVIISYICAVCPNIKINYFKSYVRFISSAIFARFILISVNLIPHVVREKRSRIYFLFTLIRFKFLLLLIIFIFITLLRVTTQFLSPSGPFRSI